MTYTSLSDGNQVKWDIRSDEIHYGTNLTGNTRDTARWEIKDDGALCVKWQGRSQDGCSFHLKNGDKVLRTATNKPTAAISSEILEIK